MINKLTNFGHKLLGLYLIGGFTTLALVGDAFAQTNSGQPSLGFGVDAAASEGIGGVSGAGTNNDNLMSVIKTGINWALGLVSTIAFGYLLYGGYKMITSAGQEDAYDEGVRILKNAAIGIAFIAVSWLLVTFIFAAVKMVTGA